jgi:hypothetical protein
MSTSTSTPSVAIQEAIILWLQLTHKLKTDKQLYTYMWHQLTDDLEDISPPTHFPDSLKIDILTQYGIFIAIPNNDFILFLIQNEYCREALQAVTIRKKQLDEFDLLNTDYSQSTEPITQLIARTKI